jgi:hypothetical protein
MKIFNLRNFIALIVILSFAQYSFAQSKTATEEWIKTTIEDPEYRFNQYHNYEIDFNNGNLIIKSPFLSHNYESILPLKSLGKIKLQKLDDGYRLTISCTNGKCIKEGEYVGANLNDYQFSRYISQTVIVFGSEFQNDGLPERLKKAITHLVQLNGGKLIGETF